MKKERQKRKKKEERITYKERMWCLRERERGKGRMNSL